MRKETHEATWQVVSDLMKERPLSSSSMLPGLADVGDHTFYDRLTLAPKLTRPKIYMFREPVSTEKGIEQTNMEQCSRLADPQWMSILSVTIAFTSKDKSTQDFRSSYMLNLVIGRKTYIEMPLVQWCGDKMPVLRKDALFEGETAIAEIISKSDYQTLELTLPLVILQGQYFCVELEGTPIVLENPVIMYVMLSGILSRGVQ